MSFYEPSRQSGITPYGQPTLPLRTRFRYWLAGLLWSWSALLYDGIGAVNAKDARGGPNGR